MTKLEKKGTWASIGSFLVTFLALFVLVFYEEPSDLWYAVVGIPIGITLCVAYTYFKRYKQKSA